MVWLPLLQPLDVLENFEEPVVHNEDSPFGLGSGGLHHQVFLIRKRYEKLA